MHDRNPSGAVHIAGAESSWLVKSVTFNGLFRLVNRDDAVPKSLWGGQHMLTNAPVKLKQPWSILLICVDLQMPQQRAQKAIAGHLVAAMATILL